MAHWALGAPVLEMNEVPTELMLLAAVLVPIALGLTWLLRADWRTGGQWDWWRPIEDSVSLLLMLTMLAASLLQVATRYLLADYVSVPWTEELSRLAMIWAAFWGAAVLQRSDDHITMGMLHDLMPPRAQRVLRLFVDLVVVVVMAPMAWFGWRNAVSLEVISTVALGLPLAVFAYAVPVSGALMILHTLVLLWRRLRGETIPSHFEPGI
jgi:TRAP-type C4-dicarboxylate transport system permease small subunit